MGWAVDDGGMRGRNSNDECEAVTGRGPGQVGGWPSNEALSLVCLWWARWVPIFSGPFNDLSDEWSRPAAPSANRLGWGREARTDGYGAGLPSRAGLPYPPRTGRAGRAGRECAAGAGRVGQEAGR